ncbi:MAG: hypothetical protein IH840_08560 [Candidatus Heimdallarchaeota archaeon]|nr:hypothetical protein [Candidatus Heimdallarchaeota archaeon]
MENDSDTKKGKKDLFAGLEPFDLNAIEEDTETYKSFPKGRTLDELHIEELRNEDRSIDGTPDKSRSLDVFSEPASRPSSPTNAPTQAVSPPSGPTPPPGAPIPVSPAGGPSLGTPSPPTTPAASPVANTHAIPHTTTSPASGPGLGAPAAPSPQTSGPVLGVPVSTSAPAPPAADPSLGTPAAPTDPEPEPPTDTPKNKIAEIMAKRKKQKKSINKTEDDLFGDLDKLNLDS